MDGVIALTPEVIKSLLRVTGPVTVPGYDLTVTADNFVMLTQDQVTYSYDRTVNQPKQFLADLTPMLLQKLFAAPAPDALRVLGSLGQSISEKQLLIYFRDHDIQQRIHEAGWDGTLPVGAPGFLHVNNANIGGHKSDQFMEQEIDYRSTIQSQGDVDVTVTVRRTHRGPEEALDYDYPEGENPAYKDNIIYQRVLVPQGAQLLEAQGFAEALGIPTLTDATDVPLVPDEDLIALAHGSQQHASNTMVGQEAGYTSFGNWIITRPGATTITMYRYRLPNQATVPGWLDAATRYHVYVAKQPGDTRTDLRVEVRVPEGMKASFGVPPEGLTRPDERTVVYRGHLRKDSMVGAVLEHAE